MKRNRLIFIGLLLLASCRFVNPSTSSSSFPISIPPVSDEFLPYLDGRKFLIQQSKTMNYRTVTIEDLIELPLANINYPTNEVFITSYAVKDAVVGQFDQQTITFDSITQPDVSATIASLAVGEVVTETDTVALLNQLTTSDESFNQLSVVFEEKNFSHPYFESEYYWFNNYIIEESMVIQRHQNQVLFGTGNQSRTFQTEVSVPISIQYQLYADSAMIYEIRDETFPSNFFGARDLKFETIRTEDNFKQALTLGPATNMLGFWQLVNQESIPYGFSPQQPLATYQKSFEMKKTSDNMLTFYLRIFEGISFETSLETFEFQASLNGNLWVDVRTDYRLWEPSVSS